MNGDEFQYRSNTLGYTRDASTVVQICLALSRKETFKPVPDGSKTENRFQHT